MHFSAIITAITSLAITHTLAAPIDASNFLVARAEQSAQELAAKMAKSSHSDWPFSFDGDGKYGYGFRSNKDGYTFNYGDSQFGHSKDGYFYKTPAGNYDLTRGIAPDGSHFGRGFGGGGLFGGFYGGPFGGGWPYGSGRYSLSIGI